MTAGILSRRLRDESHDGERGNAFATAAFANQRDLFALLNREAHVIDGSHIPGFRLKIRFEILNI
jgi:hypothetical protein